MADCCILMEIIIMQKRMEKLYVEALTESQRQMIYYQQAIIHLMQKERW